MGGVLKQERQEDKRKRFLTFLKQIKTWQLFLSLLPLLFLSATFLRFDHLKMIDLKTQVEKADEGKAADGTDLPQAEIDQNIRTALKKLRDFSSSHTIVNFVEKNGHTTLTFGTGPIYLEHQYNRQATVALREAESKLSQNPDGNPNGNIFAKAMETCKPQAIRNGWGWNSPGYLNCMTSVINSYPATDKLTTSLTADLPPTALYRYDFVSPIWTPSLSGITVLLCVLIIITIIIRLIIFAFLRLALLFLK